jgi:YfiH family protein
MSEPTPLALRSPLLSQAGFRHAFFTRHGGVSQGAYASLNFSFAVGDDAANVDQNLRRAAALLGVDVSRLYFLSQIHGNRCVELTGDEEQRHIVFTEADALVSSNPAVGCGVRTADCVPVLVADPLTGRVGAAHAGWRGLVSGVIGATVERVVGDGETSRCIAAVGPHIEAGAFEVSQDVAEQLREASPGVDPIVRGYDKPHVDLRLVAEAQLTALGFARANIDHVAGCTYTQPDRFFSFRRDGQASGRHLSVIVPREPHKHSGFTRRIPSASTL